MKNGWNLPTPLNVTLNELIVGIADLLAKPARWGKLASELEQISPYQRSARNLLHCKRYAA
jgi:hypothetical protein